MVCKYLQKREPPWAIHDFGVGDMAWWPDHFTPKLTNSIKYLVEHSAHCLKGPPKALMNYPEPLIMTHNMKEHGNLLLNRATTSFFDKASSSKLVAKSKKWCSFHPKHGQALSISAVEDHLEG
jgi:hypothetical protein